MELPPHATAEIDAARGKRKVELQKFWAAWAAAGDARIEIKRASGAAASSELEFRACRMELLARAAGSLPPGVCACGKHEQLHAGAVAALVDARRRLVDAVARQKAGG